MKILTRLSMLSAGLVVLAMSIGGISTVTGNPGQAFAAEPSPPAIPPVPPDHVAVGGGHSCAIVDPAGLAKLRCWGGNRNGQIGDGTLVSRYKPVTPIGMGHGVKSVTAGTGHTCVLMKSDSPSVLCWGRGDYGQVGDGTIYGSASPGYVYPLGTNALYVAAGALHTCAIMNDHGVKCWGSNIHGELGDGTVSLRSLVPVDVIGLQGDIIGLTLGAFYTCALNTAGRVRCWGANDQGQLGNGKIIDSPTPVLVPLGGIAAISAGDTQTCALTKTGAVFCWGNNQYGELGDGTTVSRSSPVRVRGLATSQAISAGYLHTCALQTNGRMKCWGFNVDGELGNNSETNSSLPVNVLGPAATELSSKGYHNCARSSTGAMECWGLNGSGEIGIGKKIYTGAAIEPRPVYVNGF